MKKMKFFRSHLLFVGFIGLLMACSDSDDTTPTVDCSATGPALTLGTVTNSACGLSSGEVVINVTGGTGALQVSVNGTDLGAVTTGGTVNSLPTGTSTITITDANGCTSSQDVQILSTTSFATHIQPILETSCILPSCHNGDLGAARDWQIFANVQAKAAGIKSRTASGDMPRGGGTLTPSEIELIACWVDDGAMNN